MNQTAACRLPCQAFAAFAFLVLAGCVRRPAPQPLTVLYREIHPSVAFLTMKAPSDDPKRHGAMDDAYGSGFVVDGPQGVTRIVTAKHVIDDATGVRASLGDASRPASVRVVAVDDSDDLALLEVPRVDGAAPLRLGDGSGVVPGEDVAVIGYPIPDAFGDDGLGVTASIYGGHVASLRKGAIELDLAIIPGESGAPVFASDGSVIGVAESRFEDERAIGFATPVDLLRRFLEKHRS
jgi:S1-C subfamily serine protease